MKSQFPIRNEHHRQCLKLSLPLLIGGITLGLSSTATASGFFLQEATVANAGTAGAGDGVYTQSAAAMSRNPATMSFMGESLTTVNLMVFDLEMKYRGDEPGGNATASSTTPTLGLFHAREINEAFHLGIGMGVTGGANLDYGTQWAGAEKLNEIDLAVAKIAPTLSYRYSNRLSFGGGVQISYASLEQTMASALVEIKEDTDWAFGYKLGAMYRHSDNLDFGLSYRSKVEHTFKTEARSGGAKLADVSVDIDVPAIVDFSMRYGVSPNLDLYSSVQYHRWSDWDNTTFDINDGSSSHAVALERDWDDVWHFAFAADYRLNSDWRLKAGIAYETSPQNSADKQWADMPVDEQWRYSIGASTEWRQYHIDMFYQYADFGNADIAQRDGPSGEKIGVNGKLDGTVHFVGVNVSF